MSIKTKAYSPIKMWLDVKPILLNVMKYRGGEGEEEEEAEEEQLANTWTPVTWVKVQILSLYYIFTVNYNSH